MRHVKAVFGLILLLMVFALPAFAQEQMDIGLIVVKEKNLADSLRQRLLKGEPFENLAKANSVGPAANRGGRLGMIDETRLRSEYRQALKNLPPGQPSQVIPTEEGYSIIVRFDVPKRAAAPVTPPPARTSLMQQQESIIKPAPSLPSTTEQPPRAAPGSRISLPPAALDEPPHLASFREILVGLEGMVSGNFKDAEAAFSRAVGKNPKDDSAPFYLQIVREGLAGQYQPKAMSKLAEGYLAMMQGEIQQAWDDLTQALEMDNRLWIAKSMLAELNGIMGNREQACKMLGEVLKEHPSYGPGYISLGVFLLEQGKVEEAEVAYRQALTVNPDMADAHQRLGNLYTATGQIEQAEQEFKAAVVAYPYSGETYNDLGYIYLKTNKYQLAEDNFQKALELDPTFLPAHINLGSLYGRTNRPNKAIDEFNMALSLNPSSVDAHQNLALTYLIQEKWDLAIMHADKVVSLGGQLPPLIMEKLSPHRK